MTDTEPIEWNRIWETKYLIVEEIKRLGRSIYVLSDPTRKDDVIAVEGKELIAFARLLLLEEE